MPWQAIGPRDVTILRAPGRRLTKLVTEAGVIGYDRVAVFDPPDAVRIDDIEDVLALLTVLAGHADTCVIRGVLKPEFAGRPKVLRRLHDRPGEPAPFVEAPRSWVMIDVEHVANPGVDPADPELVGGVVRRRLPMPFRSAGCVVQLSSQAGLDPGLRCHLWFMLDRPLARAELKRWLEPVAGVDLSVFGGVQVHYTAAPVFADGVDDPCHERLGLLPGYAEVEVPALPDPVRPRATYAPTGVNGIGIGQCGSRRAEAYAQACLQRLAMVPEGRRHPTCVAVSCRLLALAKAGLLDPTRVAAQIKGVMLGRGFDGRHGRDLDEVDKILEWAWQTVEPEGLPHVR